MFEWFTILLPCCCLKRLFLSRWSLLLPSHCVIVWRMAQSDSISLLTFLEWVVRTMSASVQWSKASKVQGFQVPRVPKFQGSEGQGFDGLKVIGLKGPTAQCQGFLFFVISRHVHGLPWSAARRGLSIGPRHRALVVRAMVACAGFLLS